MAGDFDESEPTHGERLRLRLRHVEAERDRLVQLSINLDLRLKVALAELDALRGPYSAAESLPARQATMPPMDGPVIRQEVKTEAG